MFFGKSLTFNPEQDIPSLAGKVILVTGANIGLGKQCVLEYARHQPSLIWLAARTIDKAQTAADEIRQQVKNAPPIKPLAMDLSSLSSVATAARTVVAESTRLDILMLNAGIMAAPPGLTSDGYELQFGTNYIGHALFTKLLLPVLEKTAAMPDADVRIVSLSSHGHVYAPKEGVLFDTLRTDGESLGAYGRYGQSKLAIILWTRQMARNPWVIRVLGKVANKVVTPVDQGVRNQLWASVAKEVKSGEYYEPIGIGGPQTPKGEDDVLALKVWEWTEKELQGYE
ncbi:hypothetical protein N7468_008701 [Penicillium chermesinum]|uniref:NAD(P)-binding protein n=1 Tax=Penicillium chermesinum TaxID=63820 RepID=A0A9W9TE53_9EURO|nr:uncharacterized protein N7468_008701 [Penicillium chermesinum]KAJ5219497.1 hypothetical protein N7468_008701 [Penicillium chermesinum]